MHAEDASEILLQQDGNTLPGTFRPLLRSGHFPSSLAADSSRTTRSQGRISHSGQSFDFG